jgi:hypothetical protein
MGRPSADFNVGDLAILRNSAFHPQHNGMMAEIIAPEEVRVSLTPSCLPRPAARLYKVRLILSVGDGDPAIFLAARYQLQPIDLGDPPWRVPQWRFRPARVSRSDPDTGGAGSRALVDREVRP